jgi:hypothetical protein
VHIDVPVTPPVCHHATATTAIGRTTSPSSGAPGPQVAPVSPAGPALSGNSITVVGQADQAPDPDQCMPSGSGQSSAAAEPAAATQPA